MSIDALKLEDTLTRYIFEDKYINFQNKTVTTITFGRKPPPDGFSVFKTSGFRSGRTWLLAAKWVIPEYRKNNPEKDLLGWCDLKTAFYLEAILTVQEAFPPFRHHLIDGMPVGNNMEEARKLAMRQRMVLNSQLVLTSDLCGSDPEVNKKFSDRLKKTQ